MNWSRDKNFLEEKAVHGEIYCMLSFGGGSLNNELESWQELFSRESCEWGGNLNNELESRQELFGRENCASRNSIACWAWGGKFKQ